MMEVLFIWIIYTPANLLLCCEDISDFSIDEYFIISHCQGNAKIWSIVAVQGAIAGDHFHCKSERNIVLQLE